MVRPGRKRLALVFQERFAWLEVDECDELGWVSDGGEGGDELGLGGVSVVEDRQGRAGGERFGAAVVKVGVILMKLYAAHCQPTATDGNS